MAIIEYDTNPELSFEDKLKSLRDSTQMALNELLSIRSGANSVGNMSKTDLSKQIEQEIKAQNQKIFEVGTIISNVTGRNPAEYLGFGTWVEWSPGRTPVGVNANDPSLAAAELTGGSKDAVVVQHSHEVGNHRHNLDTHRHNMQHTHDVTGLATTAGEHSHGSPKSGYGFVVSNDGISEHKVESGSTTDHTYLYSDGDVAYTTSPTGSGGSHDHPIDATAGAMSSTQTSDGGGGSTHDGGAGNTGQTGEEGTGANMMPYTTCYFFKRTA